MQVQVDCPHLAVDQSRPFRAQANNGRRWRWPGQGPQIRAATRGLAFSWSSRCHPITDSQHSQSPLPSSIQLHGWVAPGNSPLTNNGSVLTAAVLLDPRVGGSLRPPSLSPDSVAVLRTVPCTVPCTVPSHANPTIADPSRPPPHQKG